MFPAPMIAETIRHKTLVFLPKATACGFGWVSEWLENFLNYLYKYTPEKITWLAGTSAICRCICPQSKMPIFQPVMLFLRGVRSCLTSFHCCMMTSGVGLLGTTESLQRGSTGAEVSDWRWGSQINSDENPWKTYRKIATVFRGSKDSINPKDYFEYFQRFQSCYKHLMHLMIIDIFHQFFRKFIFHCSNPIHFGVFAIHCTPESKIPSLICRR